MYPSPKVLHVMIERLLERRTGSITRSAPRNLALEDDLTSDEFLTRLRFPNRGAGGSDWLLEEMPN